MICSSCNKEITNNTRMDNRYRGCSICGWRMHHHCWIEHLTDATLPCPTQTVTYETKRRGKILITEEEQTVEGHGRMFGMNGEWEYP